MSNVRSRVADTFDVVLRDLLAGTKWTHIELGARLGVSTKTIGRYVSGQAAPPVRARHSIVAALRDVDPTVLARLAASLGVPTDAIPARPPLDATAAQRIVDAAVQEVAERLDSGPLRVRTALAKFLSRLVEAHLDLRSANTVLTKR